MDVAETLQKSLRECDPRVLLVLSEHLSTRQQIDNFQNELRGLVLKESDLDLLVQWTWHDELKIQKIARSIILLLDTASRTSCFEKFLISPQLSFPYELDYNASEYEFHIELPVTHIGFGVSHYGREEPGIDRLLLALEQTYQKRYPENKFTWFRK